MIIIFCSTIQIICELETQRSQRMTKQSFEYSSHTSLGKYLEGDGGTRRTLIITLTLTLTLLIRVKSSIRLGITDHLNHIQKNFLDQLTSMKLSRSIFENQFIKKKKTQNSFSIRTIYCRRIFNRS